MFTYRGRWIFWLKATPVISTAALFWRPCTVLSDFSKHASSGWRKMLKMGDLSGTGCSFSIVADGAGLLFFYSLLCTELFNVGSKPSLKGKNALLETKKTANVKRSKRPAKMAKWPKMQTKKIACICISSTHSLFASVWTFFPQTLVFLNEVFFGVLRTLQRIFFSRDKTLEGYWVLSIGAAA